MMQTVGTERQSVAARVPGHHRPFITKQLKCQSLHCGINRAAGCPAHPVNFLLRHRSAADMRLARPKSLWRAPDSPILQQFGALRLSPIKAAAPERNIRHIDLPIPATIGAAHALVICPLPHRKQRQRCLRFSQDMAFLWSPCICAGHG